MTLNESIRYRDLLRVNSLKILIHLIVRKAHKEKIENNNAVNKQKQCACGSKRPPSLEKLYAALRCAIIKRTTQSHA